MTEGLPFPPLHQFKGLETKTEEKGWRETNSVEWDYSEAKASVPLGRQPRLRPGTPSGQPPDDLDPSEQQAGGSRPVTGSWGGN